LQQKWAIAPRLLRSMVAPPSRTSVPMSKMFLLIENLISWSRRSRPTNANYWWAAAS